jgi:NAD(P)-dependent dehydrogenase (short-subunit alcohol dehydrogenase family)
VAYGQSKTANILFGAELAEKLNGKGVLAFSLGPGRKSRLSLQFLSREKEAD